MSLLCLMFKLGPILGGYQSYYKILTFPKVEFIQRSNIQVIDSLLSSKKVFIFIGWNGIDKLTLNCLLYYVHSLQKYQKLFKILNFEWFEIIKIMYNTHSPKIFILSLIHLKSGTFCIKIMFYTIISTYLLFILMCVFFRALASDFKLYRTNLPFESVQNLVLRNSRLHSQKTTLCSVWIYITLPFIF